MPSLNEVARMIGDTKAQANLDAIQKVVEGLRQSGHWVLISPRGEMFVGKDADMLRVLMTNIDIATRFKNGL